MAGSRVRLVCPLCGDPVVDGDASVPGACPNCAARVEGDGESAPEAVRAALEAFAVDDVPPDELLAALFAVTPERAREIGITITSDEREGFYHWWVFLRDGADPRERVGALIAAVSS